MIEAIAKFGIYLAFGAGLLVCNLWYVRSVIQSIRGGDLVIVPVKVAGGTGDAAIAGETLARMIISKLQSLEWDLIQSQSALGVAGRGQAGPMTGQGIVAGILSTPRTAGLHAQLFDPTNIDIKVAGVEVGGWLPRIQSWFLAERTLAFSVSWEGSNAIVAGSVDALGVGATKPLSMLIQNATPNAIADAVASAMIHRLWAKDSPQFGDLEDDEFSQLIASINDVARINRNLMTYQDLSAKERFGRVLTTIGPLADRLGGWNELTYFAASIAEGAGNDDDALKFYRRLRSKEKPLIPAEILAAKIASLEARTITPAGDTNQTALRNIQTLAKQATAILNDLFHADVQSPKVELKDDNFLNVYWDGGKIYAPPIAQNIPDLIYHESTFQFIEKMWKFKYAGQEGSLVVSYTDVLTSLIKQRVLHETAETADWVIAPGAIAWLTGKPKEISTDLRPLRSLKAPGTAYDDPLLGRDPQPDHNSKFVKLGDGAEDDFGGVHINSGIPNRAFYEAALRIGSDVAGRIWIASLGQFPPNVDLRSGSKIIYQTSVKLYGQDSKEAKAVQEAWDVVGLH